VFIHHDVSICEFEAIAKENPGEQIDEDAIEEKTDLEFKERLIPTKFEPRPKAISAKNLLNIHF
jgi:hypothetical protein